ncbi:MAG: type I restriction endonuclease subunit R [Methanobrevibacter sp.]|uniref:type I restriction endonuclease subunit R n=1 Tax=Methanobrevibacter sp. TaxID=66852 RepID=UPI0025D00713|nr:type I restriction endonuclease subunit R [Methanobrevibacter sp.]MBR3113962.1 type I restriction endonuclease subunit R [Methanobrevibacter sp.]MBR3197560.1 type I restriction endonuclease subunit R [Methanobrevibacter sp.]
MINISFYNEEAYENALIELFQNLGYDHYYGPDVDRDYKNPLFINDLENLYIINRSLDKSAVDKAIETIQDFGIGSLEDKNNNFMEYLQNGINVSYWKNGKEESTHVKLVDFNDLDSNLFTVINQWTVVDAETKIPDIVVFVNGFPLVVCELKSPARDDTDTSEAYTQLKKYMQVIPTLFNYNAFCVMSDMSISKAGTITANEDRFMEWKTTDGSYETTQWADFTTFFEGIFEKNRFIDIIKNFITFSNDSTKKVKILGAYHQYFAVNKAVESTLKAINSDHKAGVFWHTQGSGKSLSMVFYVNKLQQILESPTFVVITDRNDLDDQLFTQFSKCSDFLRQTPKQATSMKNLKDLLNNIQANGIFFTTMQKFDDYDEALTERDDVIVISDEAHRSQYGLEETVNPITGEIRIGAARRIRNALPNATYIGFTGTPISKSDKSTREVFGNYIDIYDMTQSVEDGATVPISYESRIADIKLDESVLQIIDDKYWELREEAEEYNIEKSKHELSKMESLLGAPEIIDDICNDIVKHYEDNRKNELTGKAMIVAYSRSIAIKMYEKILELRPDWDEKVKVVMSGSNKDPEEWYKIIGDKSYKKGLESKFKDDEDPMKIAIVVDMWLTGFDVPSLATMYIYKPMKGHNLMQAIARVNRVFKGKEGGLIVDYIGIASELKKAMSEYTERDQKKYGDMDVDKIAYPNFQEKLEVCRDLFHGFDYTKFFGESDLERSQVISSGVNFMEDLSREETKKLFLKEALLLKKWLSLCRSRAKEKERFEAAFFEAVRTVIVKVSSDKKLSLNEINKQITELLNQSIKSTGVINVINVSDEVSLFDPEFLDRVRAMESSNFTVSLLEKLLNDQVKVYRRTNIVKSEEFSNLLKETMNSYVNGHITNDEVIEELIKIAKLLRDAHEEGEELGLTEEELAFYNAIALPENIHDFYDDETLVKLTQELTDSLRRNRTIDWQKKESARAKMRMTVKKLLKKYKYPPKDMEFALEKVIAQCELWVDESA